MELEQENYHDIDRINARKDNVLRLWNYLLELLRARRSRLELSLLLQHNFQVKTTQECRVDISGTT
jgi:spectrin beta